MEHRSPGNALTAGFEKAVRKNYGDSLTKLDEGMAGRN
jgi:hypothetical protein